MGFHMITCGDKTVPELIFGSLTMAPLQRNLSVEEGGKIIAMAIKRGIRWIDTAQMYGSYPHVRHGIKLSSIDRDLLVISTKSLARSYDEMNFAIEEALKKLDTSYIDIFLLHGVRSYDDFKERESALEALIKAKEKGKIKFIGASTHTVACARAICMDKRLSWYHLIINHKGIGLLDGTIEDQEEVMKMIKRRGASIYAMKPLGGGYLKNDAITALNWVKNHSHVDAVAVGMTSMEEVEVNCNFFMDLEIPYHLVDKIKSIDKKLFVFKPLCNGCGVCEKTCEQKAIEVVQKKAVVDIKRCITCGYCVPECPQFAIRII